MKPPLLKNGNPLRGSQASGYQDGGQRPKGREAHAVHIHEVASCQPCGATKGHYDPGPFGKSTPDAPDFNHPYHMGDLVNIDAVNGVGKVHMATSRVTLSSSRLSVFDENRSAFIIHTNEDLYCGQDVN
ncbi:MAG: superoxide dismutase family protein [Nitrospirales bacterium]